LANGPHELRDPASGHVQVSAAISPAFELGNIMNHLNRFIRNRAGATAIEYAVLLAGMGLAVIGILSVFGVQLNDLFLLLAAANT
jgi:Flp pilus assembly pilin Flp